MSTIINSGAQQASILKPLVFIIYINDIFNLTGAAEFTAYADNITLIFTITNFTNVI